MEVLLSEACESSDDGDLTSNFTSKNVKTDDIHRQEEENYFFKLKNSVLDMMITLKHVSEKDIHNALSIIIESFKTFSFPEINLSQWDYACAYFHRFGTQGSGLTRFKVMEAFKNCEDLVAKFKESNVSIISLGGGPGNDVVGLTSALYESKIQSNLNITIMDSVKEWSSFVNILKVFIKEGNYGNASRYFNQREVNLSFMKAKMPGDLKKNLEYKRILRKADVILMTRFISSVKREVKSEVIESVYDSMKNGAFALVIDAPYFEDNWRHFETLYLSKAGEIYECNSDLTMTERFGHNESYSTKAQIAVLRKD